MGIFRLKIKKIGRQTLALRFKIEPYHIKTTEIEN